MFINAQSRNCRMNFGTSNNGIKKTSYEVAAIIQVRNHDGVVMETEKQIYSKYSIFYTFRVVNALSLKRIR